MSTHKPVTLLHISDIQLQDVERESFLPPLIYDLKKLKARYALKPQVLVVSGDLAERGTTEEFRRVEAFLRDVASELSLDTSRIVIVPGNHDINWKDCETGHFADPKITPPQPYPEKWRKFMDFFDSFYAENRPEGLKFTLEQPWTIFELEPLKMVFAGINSTWSESHLKKHHFGLIGESQIQWFSEKLSGYKHRDWFRVAVLHHNIAVTNKKDDSYLKDSALFYYDIYRNVNLVLHGHTHQATAENREGVPILSTGSPTVPRKLRPADVPRQYHVIQLWPAHYQRWARLYSQPKGLWIGDCSISIDGNSWNERRVCQFSSVKKTFRSVSDDVFSHATGFIEAGDAISSLSILAKQDQMASPTQ
ncbi:MAG: metallophosphoesterase family protein, partial [Pyrinomonadaceae bacterium]